MRRRLPILLAVIIMMSTVTCYAVDGWTDKQNQAHEIANIARSMQLPESNPIIVEASRIWFEEQKAVEAQRAEEQKQKALDEEAIAFANSMPNEATAIAHVMYSEARGLDARELSMVAWTILNRYDAGGRFGKSIMGVICYPNQFAYNKRSPLVSDRGIDLVWLAKDVLARWYKEKQGATDVGRTLPAGYYFYYGNGSHNLFRQTNSGKGSYNFGLPNPYQ